MEKRFTLEEVLDLLVAIQQVATPHLFNNVDGTPSTLESIDFVDLALSKAKGLNVEKEYEKLLGTLNVSDLLKN